MKEYVRIMIQDIVVFVKKDFVYKPLLISVKIQVKKVIDYLNLNVFTNRDKTYLVLKKVLNFLLKINNLLVEHKIIYASFYQIHRRTVWYVLQ